MHIKFIILLWVDTIGFFSHIKVPNFNACRGLSARVGAVFSLQLIGAGF